MSLSILQSLQSVTVRFPDDVVRAATIEGRICRAVATTMRDSKLTRPEIAVRISEFSGQRMSKHMLDAYASQAREDHVINVPRFMALLHATQDRRLLELIAEPFGWAVIERRLLPLIELAQVQKRLDDLLRHASALKHQTEGVESGTSGDITSLLTRVTS